MRARTPHAFDLKLGVVLMVGLLAFACAQMSKPQQAAPASQPLQPAAIEAPVAQGSPAPTRPGVSLPTPEEAQAAVSRVAIDGVCDCGPQHFKGEVGAGLAVEAWDAYLHADDPFCGRWMGRWDGTWPMELIFPDEAATGPVPFRYRWRENPRSNDWQEGSGTLQRRRGYAAAGDVVLLSVIEGYFDGGSRYRQRILAVGSFSQRRVALLSPLGPDGRPREVYVAPAGIRPFTTQPGPAMD